MKRLFSIVVICTLHFPPLTGQTLPPLAPEEWSEPIRIFSAGVAVLPSVTSGGDTLYCYWGASGKGIMRSVKTFSGWSDPQPLSGRFNYAYATRPSISRDGKRLYFIDYGRAGGYGGWDLWMTEWSDSLNDWGEAKNLGPNVNTDGDEWYCFTPDNKHLYFGRFGTGDFRVSQWNDSLQLWQVSQSFDNYRLTRGIFVDGLTMPASQRKVYFSRWVDTGKHIEFELLVSYRDSATGAYGDPMRLNINSHPADSIPWYNPGNLGYDGFPSVTGDGKFLFFESDRELDSSGNNYHDIYMSRLLIDEHGNPVSVHQQPEWPPEAFRLYQNFPNPFNPATTIEFDLPHDAIVRLEVFNLLGEEVATLAQSTESVGRHKVVWNGRDRNDNPVSSGVYFYSLHAGQETITRKLILLR